MDELFFFSVEYLLLFFNECEHRSQLVSIKKKSTGDERIHRKL